MLYTSVRRRSAGVDALRADIARCFVGLMTIDPCTGCHEAFAAAPARVKYSGGGRWVRIGDDAAPHLAALFRDPQIQAGRTTDVVLNLSVDPSRCTTPHWLRPFVRTLSDLPAGLVVAIDNGVRCPCGFALGPAAYRARLERCLPRTRVWLDSMRHPDGGRPGIVVCDRGLVDALAAMGHLSLRDGNPWHAPDPWIDAVGSEITILGGAGLVLAHPIVVQRHRGYRNAVATAVPKLVELAREVLQ